MAVVAEMRLEAKLRNEDFKHAVLEVKLKEGELANLLGIRIAHNIGAKSSSTLARRDISQFTGSVRVNPDKPA